MKSIIEKINAAKSIAVLGHINPDPDSIGSCFAFAHMMRLIGKEAVVYMGEKPEERLAFMGDDYIIYDGTNAGEHDLCICLDCGDMERIKDRTAIFTAAPNTALIDHHRTNTRFAQVNVVDGDAPATAELLCRLFREMELTLDTEAAKQLYTAINSDTGGFRFSSVTPQTMREAADLLEFGFDHAEITRLLYDSHSFGEMQLRATVMQSLKSYEGGKITIAEITDEMIKNSGLREDQVPNVVDIPRSVAGTEIAVLLKPKDGEIRVNLRSNGDADVSEIALKYGGGGHKKAAGCGIKGATLEEAEKIILKTCAEVLE